MVTETGNDGKGEIRNTIITHLGTLLIQQMSALNLPVGPHQEQACRDAIKKVYEAGFAPATEDETVQEGLVNNLIGDAEQAFPNLYRTVDPEAFRECMKATVEQVLMLAENTSRHSIFAGNIVQQRIQDDTRTKKDGDAGKGGDRVTVGSMPAPGRN